MKLDTNRLKKRIRASSSQAVITRGESIYRTRGVALVRSEPNSDQIKFLFHVNGSQEEPYNVTIDINKNGSINSHCTCPYDYGDACEHEVAALIYLLNNPELQTAEELKEQKALEGYWKNGWYHMPRISAIDRAALQRHVTYKNYMLNHISANLLQQQEHLFRFSAEEILELGWSDKKDVFTVLFELTEEGLKTQCSCPNGTGSTCQHQAYILHEIEEFDPEFFVKTKTNEAIPDAVKLEIAENLQLRPEDVETYVNIRHNIRGYVWSIKEAYAGIALDNYFKLQKERTSQYKKFLRRDQENEIERLAKRHPTKSVLFLCPEESEHYPVLFSQVGHAKASKKDSNTLNKPVVLPMASWMGGDDFSQEIKTLISNNLEHLYVPEYSHKNTEEEYEAIKCNFFALASLFEKKALFPHVWLHFDGHHHRNDKSQWVHLSEERYKPVLEIIRKQEIVRLRKQYIVADQVLLDNKNTRPITPITLLSENTLFLVNGIKGIRPGKIIDELDNTGCLYSNFPEFFNQVIAPITDHIEIKFSNFDLPFKIKNLKPVEKALYISELDKFLLFKPVVKYKGKHEYNPLEEGSSIRLEGNEVVTKIRDEAWEQEFVKVLQSLHPKFKMQGHKGFFNLSFEEFVEKYWFLESFETLKNTGIEVYGLKNLKNFNYATSKPQISLNISSGMDWFDVDLKVEIENEFFTLKDLKRKLVKSENYIKLGDGRLAILPEEWIEKIRKYLRLGEINKEGQLQVSKKKFTILEDIFEEGQLNAEIIQELAEKKQKLKAFKSIKKRKIPAGIQATLRNYQIEGFNWLCFLDEFGWGGILADDMGLGKTVQVITFILHRIKQKSKQPILVVVPTSLIFNWKNEIEKFAPSIDYYIHYGPSRSEKLSELKSHQLIITSYGLMYNDLSLLKKITYDYIILDESQAIKNASTSRFKAAVSLKANNRLAMTGTPIENNTFELFAQMHFTNPGFLGSAQDFKQTYSYPIDKYGNEKVAAELQKLTNPFLLRRTKEVVARELPPKTEDVIYCEMAPAQQKVYEAYRNQMRLQILDKIEEEGINQSKLAVLQALTKLRQICDSPLLLSGEEEGYDGGSAKLEVLLEHINEKTSNHKILIFSQFVKMLHLIKDKLTKNEIPFEYLDGSSTTTQRENSVKNFQDNAEIRVFLISLKAGGTGLNLTAADYVYVVDPWWNPAVENQAIDRCYRIGQDKHVIAYRMICKDTIEDKIQQYKERKQKVADSIITTDENMMSNLQREDIMELFT